MDATVVNIRLREISMRLVIPEVRANHPNGLQIGLSANARFRARICAPFNRSFVRYADKS